MQRRGRRGPRGDGRLRAFLRRLQGQSGLCAGLRPRRVSRPARAGSCSATPMAARCRTRSSASSARSRASFPATHLGIHAHNDTGNAVANSLAAVRAGARQIQGTLNGLGERCGNANLVSLIPTLALEAGATPSASRPASTREALREITQVSRAFDELLNRAPNRHAPYVGASAFATKAGIHASALVKDPRTYEHVPPESVGNSARSSGLGPGRAVESRSPSSTGSASRSSADDPRLGAPARRGQGARGAGLRLRGRRRLVRTAGAQRARRRAGVISRSRAFSVNVERSCQRRGAPIRPRRRS